MLALLLPTVFWLTSLKPDWPEPYFGFAIQSFSEKSFMGYDTTTTPFSELNERRRKKYFQLGLPFQITTFNWGDARRIRVLAIPELLFNDNSVLANFGAGIEQDIPFNDYRSVPSALFWGLAAGLHYGFILDAKDYALAENKDETTGSYTMKKLTVLDRSSIAGLFRFYFGPKFFINNSMDLKLRIGIDLLVGKVGPFQSRTSFSSIMGSLSGAQLQLAFK